MIRHSETQVPQSVIINYGIGLVYLPEKCANLIDN